MERAAVTTEPGSTSAKQTAVVRLWATYPPHPPLTDITVGAYITATVLAVLGRSGIAEANLTKGWWLALVVALSASVPTALTGFVEFVVMGARNPARRPTIAHMLLMLSTYPFFIEAARRGHSGYVEGEIATTPLALTLTGVCLLLAGGFVGGKLVYQHGLRVRPERAALRAERSSR
jgi:uncharacterized membrane protein